MALNSFDRNYGASLNSREFFFGNVGFATFAGVLPGTAELGTTTEAVADTDAYQTAASAAAYNQFKITELLAQRVVITATSAIDVDANTTARVVDGERIIAHGDIGTYAGDTRDAITFIIERADVLNAEGPKPGAINPEAYAVTPIADMLKAMAVVGFFRNQDGSDAPAIADAGITVYQWTQPILV